MYDVKKLNRELKSDLINIIMEQQEMIKELTLSKETNDASLKQTEQSEQSEQTDLTKLEFMRVYSMSYANSFFGVKSKGGEQFVRCVSDFKIDQSGSLLYSFVYKTHTKSPCLTNPPKKGKLALSENDLQLIKIFGFKKFIYDTFDVVEELSNINEKPFKNQTLLNSMF